MCHNKNPQKYENNNTNNPDNSIHSANISNIKNEITSPKERANERNAKSQNKTNNSLKSRFWSWIKTKEGIQIILVSTNIIMVIAFIVFGWIQSNQTKKSLDETREAIKRADIANFYTEQSLNYTAEAINVSKQTLKYNIIADSINYAQFQQDFSTRKENIKIELRPYVSFTSCDVSIFDTTRIQIITEIINTGKTPAYNITFCGRNLCSIEGFKSSDVEEIKKIPLIKLGNGIIGANQKFKSLGNFDISKSDYMKLIKREANLHLLNYIVYHDIFREEHFTQSYIIGIFQDSSFAFMGNPEYNDAN